LAGNDKAIEIGRIEGWVEIEVRDKDGKVKYKVGSPPEKLVKKLEGVKDCPITSSFPTKSLDLHYWRRYVITDVGLACIVRLVFLGLTEDKFGYLGIGSGTAAEAVTDTALQYEIIRKAATVSQTTTTITNDTGLLEATFSSADGLTGTANVSETGVFNLAAAGDLLARKAFAAVPIDWDAGDSLTIRYYVQMTR